MANKFRIRVVRCPMCWGKHKRYVRYRGRLVCRGCVADSCPGCGALEDCSPQCNFASSWGRFVCVHCGGPHRSRFCPVLRAIFPPTR